MNKIPFNKENYTGNNAVYADGTKPDEVIWFKGDTDKIFSRQGSFVYMHNEDGTGVFDLIDVFLEVDEMYVAVKSGRILHGGTFCLDKIKEFKKLHPNYEIYKLVEL